MVRAGSASLLSKVDLPSCRGPEDAFIYDARAINIVNGWIYFQTGEAFIDYHRLRTDGSDYQILFWEFAQ